MVCGWLVYVDGVTYYSVEDEEKLRNTASKESSHTNVHREYLRSLIKLSIITIVKIK